LLALFPVNSRFGRFISWLASNEFPVARLREFACNPLIPSAVFGPDKPAEAKIDNIPGYFPGSREFAAAGAWAPPGLG
jgi:hypothetical protein